MAELKLLNDAALPHLNEEDFEQMRIDTRKLVVENKMLKRRITDLESHIVTHAWADFKLH
jgi:hypothetical protein